MKAADLREKNETELGELKAQLSRDVFQNRLKNFTNRLDDTSAMRKTRRDLARVLTVLRAKTGAAAAPVETKAAEAPAAAPVKKAKPAKKAAEAVGTASTEAAPAEAPAKKKSTKKSEAKSS
jgi:large subunit ribosomal protein L29